jgi:hypothetical protein
MLDCKRNRLDYGQLLCPPPGYHLDQAVAATYSADLATLLSIPVALVYAQTLEGDLSGARFQLLEAIKQFSSRVKVYHQAGQLHVPTKLNWLYAHLEDALEEVLPDDAFTAFHPKVWIIRYTPIEEAQEPLNHFRIIVLSRNLTFDRSWDVAACLDGKPSGAAMEENAPLVDFVSWLHEYSPIPNVEKFLTELERVDFESPEPFEKHFFHPIGIGGKSVNPVASQKAKTTFVMSPFLHPEAINQLRANTRNQLHLFSERRELERMPVESLETCQSYHLHECIVDGEYHELSDDGHDDIQKQHLHAKLFLFEQDEGTRWFLGSANATQAAVKKNVEFLLELRGSSGALRIKRRLKELLGDNKNEGVFIPFSPGDEGTDQEDAHGQQSAHRRFEYALLKANISAKVLPAENKKNFDLHIELDLKELPTSGQFKLTVQPFNMKSSLDAIQLSPGKIDRIVFKNLAEVELSRFLHFSITGKGGDLHHQFLLKIDIQDLPEDRLENILKKIIDSQDKFFEYLRFLLAEDITKEDLLSTGEEPKHISAGDESEGDWHVNLPIYEQLLVAASRSPRKLKDIDDAIQKLTTGDESSTKVIPEAFLSFWGAFRTLIPDTHPSKS